MPINQTAFPPMWALTPPEHSVQLGGPRKIFYFNHPGNINKILKSPVGKEQGLFVTVIVSSPRLLGGRSAWPLTPSLAHLPHSM